MLRFSYREPFNGFNSASVKREAIYALQSQKQNPLKGHRTCVGGKLTNVVVDDENTGKVLIDGACFGHNISIIPNSKVVARPLSREIREECIT
jgi:hypothetical protein